GLGAAAVRPSRAASSAVDADTGAGCINGADRTDVGPGLALFARGGDVATARRPGRVDADIAALVPARARRRTEGQRGSVIDRFACDFPGVRAAGRNRCPCTRRARALAVTRACCADVGTGEAYGIATLSKRQRHRGVSAV